MDVILRNLGQGLTTAVMLHIRNPLKVIRVRVTARDVPDLTLVDLSVESVNDGIGNRPGLARVAIEGQPKDVPALTKRLVKKYIEPRNTIILVVRS